MPTYLIHGCYTTEGIKGVLKEGAKGRVDAVNKLAKSVGGKVHSFYFAFGKEDYFVTVELPDNNAAAAVAMAVAESGAVSNTTTVLLTPKEMDAAVKMRPKYRAPGK
jgi:uncharacterized protein with GYD domain